LDLGEDVGDGAQRRVLGAAAELAEGGQVGEGRRGTEVRDPEGALEPTRSREYLPPDGADGPGGQRALVQAEEALHDSSVALGGGKPGPPVPRWACRAWRGGGARRLRSRRSCRSMSSILPRHAARPIHAPEDGRTKAHLV